MFDPPRTPLQLCGSPFTVFIAEITARAFIIADSNKRRTLSRADIAKALSKSDQFDFLIDIVPREEPPGGVAQGVGAAGRTQKKGGPAGTLSAVSSRATPVRVCYTLTCAVTRRRKTVRMVRAGH